MTTELNLIQTEFQDVEKRVLPRFPLTFLLFKIGVDQHAYEVKDISHTGMQIDLKRSDHSYEKDDSISGIVHWRGPTLDIEGQVQWVRGTRIGIAFHKSEEFNNAVKDFLSFDNIIAGMRKVHETHIELPPQLQFWLRSEGPVEIFIWKHSHGELAKIQFIILDNFVEWIDGEGLHSGKLLTQRDSDLPLSLEGEFMFEIDRTLDVNKLQFCKELVRTLPEDYLPSSVVSFVLLKIGD